MILLVDDDSSVVVSLALVLKQAGFGTRVAATPAEALARLAEESFDLVLQDMNFSRRTTGEEGIVLLRAIKSAHPDLPVILMTAWASIPLAVQGIKAGALDFVAKPWNNDHLLRTIRTALSVTALRSERRQDPPPSREVLDAAYDLRGIVGRDPRLLELLDLVGRVSATDASVLVTGESGTGKELIAEAVHRNSPRRHAAFVKVNLGGISSTLFESEMFGHVRGAFTDAGHDRTGRFERADGGTIFLDEIGDLDGGSQVKLLRVLQDRTYEVLGSSATRTVDVRVVAATNRPLDEMVAQGTFREDLFYRLNLITVHLPALRERTGDIPLLAAHVLQQAARTYGRPGLSFSARALAWLREQPWPGNVRQLKHAVERAVLVAPTRVLDPEDFADLSEAPARPPRALPPVGSMTLDEIERAMIVKTLAHHGGNVSKVAEALGLSRAALYRRFRKYGIEP